MSSLVHRRQVRPAAPEARGPGGTIGPLLTRFTAPLTWIGWLSIAGAAWSLVVWVWPWVAGGVPFDAADLTVLAFLHELAAIAVILLPAALEFGYPGVARRSPWLLRGTLLLALAQLSLPLTGFVRDWTSNALGLEDGGSDPMDLEFALVQLLGIARLLLQMLGWLALLRGLVATGARPRTAVAATVVLAGVAVWAFTFLRSLDQLWSSDRMLVSATNVVAIFVGLGQSAATAAVVAALLAGAVRRLQPHLGWALGAASAIAIAGASIAVLVQTLLGPSTRPDGSPDYWLLTLIAVLNIASSLLLFAACLYGIGRRTGERRVAGPRRRAYVVTGARRLRPTGGSSPA